MRPFNLEKLRKTTNKIFGVKDGFFDPITWIDTGNYALNRMISGDFRKGIPLGGVTIFAGESGSGKSFFASGSIVRNAQAMGVTPIVLDSEGALHESWVRKLGVNVDPDTIFKAQVSMINDVARYIEETMKQYRDDNDGYPREKMQKVLFVVDSLGFLQTPTEVEQFEKHEMKGDKGIKPKMLKALVSNCIRLFSGYEVGLVATNHTYASQDMYKPDDKISGGEGQVYASSIVVSLNKSKLKTDEDGAKTKEVRGIVSKMKCV
jgi:RecA/RadA recombinase